MANRARTLKIQGTAEPAAERVEARRPRSAPRLIRIERPRLGAEQVAEREVSALPAHLLSGLPRPATLFLQVPGHDGPVAVATSAGRADAERAAGRTVFDPVEWSAIVTAAESDRMWPSDLREVCVRKDASPGWSLDLDTALAGARPDAPREWSVGRVLARLGATILAVDC